MMSSTVSAPDTPARLTYARARLLLGISGVGTAVLIASSVLVFDLAARLLPYSASQPLLGALSTLLPILVLPMLLFLPFDVVGGAIVVRARPSVPRFLTRWVRGATVQLAVWLIAAAVLMVAARADGASAAIVAFVVLQLLLAQFRAPLSRVIASFGTDPVTPQLRTVAQGAGIDASRICVAATEDEGFVGGWSGIFPRVLVLPAHWLDLPDDALVAALRRRRIIAESGAHRRGVLGAVAWNTLGGASVLALTAADLATAAGVLTLAAGMTLWAFLGALLLPTVSRAAVFTADAAAARECGTAAVSDLIEHLDQWQDDEARRSAGVETIFHPVPARTRRIERLHKASRSGGTDKNVHAWTAHHIARHALWLSWGTLSPLSRLVHCNVGRPALWAMLPGD